MPVGTTLMELRRQQGKSMSEIESSTKIMGRMLRALENERWDELPAPVYVKGYIQNYAQVLGVDPAPLLREYEDDLGKHKVEHAPLKRIPERTVVPHRFDVHTVPKQVWRAVALAVVVIAVLAWGISALVGADDTPPPIPPETTSTVGSSAAPSGDDAGPGESQAIDVPAGSFVLEIKVAEGQSSWLQVTVDSLIAYEGTLPGGEAKQWTVAEDAVVRVGKPASVTVTRDGQPVEIPAATDGIAEVVLDAGTE